MNVEENSWEDMIALNTRADSVSTVLGPAADYQDGAVIMDRHTMYMPNIEQFLEKDPFPLPTTKDRENYYC